MLQRYKKLLVLFLFLLIGFSSSASHIVGATITYEYLGGSSYRVTLKLYRDCGPTSIDFPPSVTINVRDGNNNNLGKDITIPISFRDTIDPYVDTCAVKTNLCLEQANYTKVVNNLPPRVGGYFLYYALCCRNANIQNIQFPSNTQDFWTAYIPDNNQILYNSSPTWIQAPPVFVCAGNDINFNHSATDSDGDSLVYTLFAPYDTCTLAGGTFNPIPVTYVGGFSATNPVNNGGTGLTIDQSGVIHGTPTALGHYVAGIKCSEYRDGVKISEIIRDFQFVVITCPPLAQASFTTSSACAGQTVSFTNTSNTSGGSGGATTYDWDFGDPAVITDVSTAQNPGAYSYPGIGPYTVTLIINKGTGCVDTATQVVNISFLNAAYTSPDSVCVTDSLHFTNGTSGASNSGTISYNWNFGDTGSNPNNTSTLQNPAHLFSYAGTATTYTVTLIASSAFGCKDTLKKPITVLGVPIVNALDTISCANTVAVGITGSVLNAPGGTWTVIPAPPSNTPGLFSPNANTLNPTYTPTADEVAQGYATLVLHSAGNSKCAVKTDTMHINFFAGPTANAGSDTVVCKGSPILINLHGSTTVAYGALWTAVNGTTGTITNPTSLTNAQYTPSASDIANGVAYIKLETTQNGNCNPAYDTVKVTFSNPPNVTATSGNDSTCVFKPFAVTGNSSTNSGLWTTTGDGSFGNPAQANTIYTPGIGDATTGYVWVYYNSTNNGGCKSSKDSVKVIVLKAPIADAGADTTACINNPIVPIHGSVALASGGVWSTTGANPGTIGNVNSLNTTYTPSAAEIAQGYAYVVLTGQGLISSCPPNSDSVKITFTPGPTAIIQAVGDSINVCEDTTAIPLNAAITLATGVIWSGGSGTFSPNNTLSTSYSPSAADVNNGFVILHLQTTGNGICSPSYDSVKVKFYGVPSVVATSNNDTACTSNVIAIQVSVPPGMGAGTWTTSGNGTFSPNTSTLIGTYTPGSGDGNLVTLVFHTPPYNGCKSQTDSIRVTIIPGPNTAFTNTGACPGDVMHFTDVSTTTTGSVTGWQWAFGDNTFGSGSTPVHTYTASGTYNVTLIASTSNGCKDTLVKPVIVFNKPVANFTYPVICLYQPVQLSDASTVAGSTISSWHWSLSNGHSSTQQNYVDSFNVQTGNTATLIVTSAQGCKDTVTKALNVLPQPLANYAINSDLANPYYAQIYQSLSFTDLTPNSVSWIWNFSDNSSNALTANTTHSFNIGGIYPVTLMIVDANGCKDTVIKEVIISLPPEVPSGFSPNGDGHNDVFYVLGGPFKKCHLRIYNNWGELIFESFEQKNGWDGKRNGVEQPLGVYVWVVDAENEIGDNQGLKTFNKSGDVTLLR